MQNWKLHLISNAATVKQAMAQIDRLGIVNAVLFVVDDEGRLCGSVSDGDIRRGLLKDVTPADLINNVCNASCRYLVSHQPPIAEVEVLRNKNIRFAPVLGNFKEVIGVLDLNQYRELLPICAVLMAGGRGERLAPLTDQCPKPLLKVGSKPIIEHNIDRFANFGIQHITISIRYLGEQIKSYFGDGTSKNINIGYVEEDEPLGTFGALSLIDGFNSDDILLMNSDILTNIDLLDFYKSFVASEADFMIASIPYQVKIPYAVLQISGGDVISFDEKPTYSYYSNGGIYLLKKSLLSYLNKGQFFNATDFMELLIAEKKKVMHYPILGYWLDIGRPQDFVQAQEDIKHLNF
ncbi:MAG: nucleotidyltransferase family protein [Chitinophaga sp.]|uniref:nucleotidyltransferase family protein n=1 Tax=Chitinophaga sp. TaxID=1869181 RepID=UPI001B1965E6|nr:nucleotidyltransferase family protein [Chitinophaga sp.]MBO9731728.1 nucleotidyltransferase family protein [Chitinophaga sp.]